MNTLKRTILVLAGFQWLFFLFANTVVIPISIGEALQVDSAEIVAAIQRSFIFTGVACMLQGLLGHRFAIMEGQSGLWWGIILSLAASANSFHLDLQSIGGSIALGAMISGLLVVGLGAFGMGNVLKKWFTPAVMFVFLLLLANQLIYTFFSGMVGLTDENQIDMKLACFSFTIVTITVLIHVKGRGVVQNLALLIGLIIGWLSYKLIFPQSITPPSAPNPSVFHVFPWGEPVLEWGIVMTVILTGLLNTTNTVASLKGAEDIYEQKASSKQYRDSFILSGFFTFISGIFGLVPYAPYASSLGFLQSTGIKERAPFILGSFLFLLLGCSSSLSEFFSMMPSSVGSSILFVAYVQLFRSSFKQVERIPLTPTSIYKIAIPALVGLSIKNIPVEAFQTVPTLLRPLVSNGLLMGILLVLLMEFIYFIGGKKNEKE
ncbi:uracil/xanthine transporter [Bacillus weihaiensis]|uniref:Uracil/xanthine transporter n=1 Tax=Bacillus weihaiensis TaxID=1547283 RepID=A0A1L3MRA9_9BACI|nr:uracil/xanthine transporter [Bacillus weihaiensis]APH04883.1 uracil/xanthine transporter [Bacillus weihaiensis]